MPHRIQVRRSKGWRKPDNTVYVSRPSRFGNPFRIGNYTREEAVMRYEQWILSPGNAQLLRDARRLLAGKNLGCWCPLGQLCHADILLRLLN